MKILVAGSSGFFGRILVSSLIQDNHDVVGIDLRPNSDPAFETIVCDLTDYQQLLFKTTDKNFDAIINLASQIDFAVKNQLDLLKNNVEANKNLLNLAAEKHIKKYIFTSSNSVFLGSGETIINPAQTPEPIDKYGISKVAAESDITSNKHEIVFQIIRCPNIIDEGRVGMLSILYDILAADATLWVIGKEGVRHQTIYALDLVNYIEKVLDLDFSATVNLGSEDVPTMRAMYEDLVQRIGGKSKIRSLPTWFVIPILKILHKFKLSPFGPYQFHMLTKSFEFQQDWSYLPVRWAPTKSNTDALELAYRSYQTLGKPQGKELSANRSSTTTGVMKILTKLKF